MSKPDYAAFDAELLAQINAGRNKMMLLDTHKPLLELALPFAAASKSPEFRVIDRRLQALRKAGNIHYTGQVWEVVQA